MPIERFETDKAPAPVGPYSQVVRAGDFVFTAGQIPVDMATGEIVNAPIGVATEHTLNNLKAVLEAGGASLDQCVSVSVFLSDMDDFAAMNEVYAKYFDSGKPVRAAIEAATLPKGVSIEIQATAYVGD